MNSPESQVFCGNSEIIYGNDVITTHNSEVKLFKIELSSYNDIADILLKEYLTSVEAQRAQKYRHTHDRNRFITCRSLLKYLMAKETGLEVSQIHFEKNSSHKPYFPLDRSIFFNIAHAGNYAIIAISKYELGVDVEFMDPNFDFNEIISTVFNDKEIAFIANSKDKRYWFYKFWTRKEAIVKAVGKGIDDELHKIPVTEGNHCIPTSLLNSFETIKVFSFNLNADYIGALAITEDLPHFAGFSFSPVPTSDELKYLLSSKNTN
ncbi:MAG TPA: 4'-phosphopantetheinyl transferase superfamily protein [Aquaticitalea sp.]|nr:4'-phosphopantetheinyl transferase superfamily protein [Aquaticitalea sp.]